MIKASEAFMQIAGTRDATRLRIRRNRIKTLRRATRPRAEKILMPERIGISPRAIEHGSP